MIDVLPDDVLLNVVDCLSEDPIERIVSTLSIVCRSWSEAFGAEKTRFWNGLSERYGIPLFQRPNGGRRRRSTVNIKRYFFLRKQQVDEARRLEADKVVWEIWKRLRKGDCVMWVQKRLRSTHPPTTSKKSNGIYHHRVRGLENRTLLMLACWWGRHRTVRWLLEQDDEVGSSSSIFCVDDGNASALLIAAWSGHIAVVKLLLERLVVLAQSDRNLTTHHLNLEGIPPLTSSCGGRGPKTAICWAERKGFRNVVRVLEKAGANTDHRIEPSRGN